MQEVSLSQDTGGVDVGSKANRGKHRWLGKS